MDYLNQFALQYEGLIALCSGLFGAAGFGFGVWRHYKERKARAKFEESQRELEEARHNLQNLRNFASGLKQYSAPV